MSGVIQGYLVYILLIKFIELKIGQEQKGRLGVHETSILAVIFVTLTESSSVLTNNTQGTRKYPHYWK